MNPIIQTEALHPSYRHTKRRLENEHGYGQRSSSKAQPCAHYTQQEVFARQVRLVWGWEDAG